MTPPPPPPASLADPAAMPPPPEEFSPETSAPPADGQIYLPDGVVQLPDGSYVDAENQPFDVNAYIAGFDLGADATPAADGELTTMDSEPLPETSVPPPETKPAEDPATKKQHFSMEWFAGRKEKSETKPDMTIECPDLRLFDEVLQDAVNTQCADLHIKESHSIHFRISRALRDRDFPVPTKRWMEQIIDAMCPEHFKANLKKDREVDFSYFNPKYGRFRVNVFSQTGQWSMAMRYIKNEIPSIEKLGIAPKCLEVAEFERGLVLLAGITGSGKSTTIAAMVQHLNRNFRKHIITIEDPVEFMFKDEQCVIEQREVGLDTESFQRALKSALREDPDIVMVGEMRDGISIQAAIRAADTGCMVLSTIHTTAASTIPGRILDFYPVDERDSVRKALASVLMAGIAQRMCPKIGGGMLPAQEIMIGTPLVRQKIFDNELNKLHACIEASRDDGMLSFNQCLFDAVNKGIISKQMALDKCSNKQQLQMWFQGIQINMGIV